jgi:hypothetical protein
MRSAVARDVTAFPVLAGEPAAAEGAPRNHAHAVVLAGRQHHGFHPAHEDRVRRLLADVACVSAFLRHPLRFGDLRRREGRGAEVPDLAGALEIGERAECLVVIGRGIPAVDLIEVDPVRLQASEAVLDLLDDPAARVALHVRIGVVHRPVHLGRKHDRIAAALECLTDDLLGFAARVHVGRVDEVDPRIKRAVNGGDPLVVVGISPRAEHHRAETQRTDVDAGVTELAVGHLRSVLPDRTSSPTTHACDAAIDRRTLRVVDTRVRNTHTSSFCSGAFGAGATTEGRPST